MCGRSPQNCQSICWDCCPEWTSPHGCVCGGVLSPWPSHPVLPTPAPPGPFLWFQQNPQLLPALAAHHASSLSLPPAALFAWKSLRSADTRVRCPVNSASPGQQPSPRGPSVFVCTPVTASIVTGRPLFILCLRQQQGDPGGWEQGPGCPEERVRAPGSQAARPALWPGPACGGFLWLLW